MILETSSDTKSVDEAHSDLGHPLPALPTQRSHATHRRRMSDGGAPPLALTRSMEFDPGARSSLKAGRSRSGVDWIVPLDEKVIRSLYALKKVSADEWIILTCASLYIGKPTLEIARSAKKKSEDRAKLTGWSLNGAIGLQVLLGTLTTGLAVVTSGKQTAIMTTVLGGVSTVVASFLAKMRGSNEPEFSTQRAKELERFVRECETFILDYGHEAVGGPGSEWREKLQEYRNRLESILKNEEG